VKISFVDHNLKKYASNEKVCKKKLGEKRANLFLRRISELTAANTLEDVRYLPGHYHELTGDRKGQWACDLDQPYRLVFRPSEEPIPEDEHHRYIWAEILEVDVMNIVDYH